MSGRGHSDFPVAGVAGRVGAPAAWPAASFADGLGDDRTKTPLVLAVGLLAALTLSAAGCDSGGNKDAIRELQACRQENLKLKNQVAAQQDTLAGQEKQIQTLMGLGDRRLDVLFHVVALEVGRYCSGLNTDDKPGDDMIRVYLRPLDRVGDPIKAAGAVKIQFFDLANPPEANLIATYEFALDAVAKSWYGGLITYHYRFDCPWKSGPPAHPDITVRATFTDYLTGKEFTDQKVVKVALPPSTQPATTAVSR